jgi:hypothetical protein
MPGAETGHVADRAYLRGPDLLVLSIPGGADLWMPGPIDKRHAMAKNPFDPDDVTLSFGANRRARM